MRITRPIVTSLGLLTLLGAAACGKDAPPPAATTQAPAATTSAPAATAPSASTTAEADAATAEPTPPLDITPTVELVDAGAEPRAERRYAPTVGTTQRFALTMQMGVTVTSHGRKGNRVILPPVVLEVDLKVDAVTPPEKIAYGFTVTGFRYDSDEPPTGVAEALLGDLKLLEGATGAVTTDAQGRALHASYSLDDQPEGPAKDAHMAFRKALTQLAVPLPAEPIGVGASWAVTQPVKQSGVVVAQRTVYTLTAATADTLKATMTITQDAEGAAAPDARTTIRRFEGAGAGRAELALSQLAPVSYAADLKTSLAFDVNAGAGKPLEMALDVDLAMRVGDPDAPAPDEAPAPGDPPPADDHDHDHDHHDH